MLPTEKRKVIDDISQEIIFAYGIPKVGKSTFFSNFPDAVFLSTEEGLGHLEVFEAPINKWIDFLVMIDELEKSKQFKTIVIDTVDNLWMFCQEFIYSKFSIGHESDLEWGKGWAYVEREFRKQVTRLSKIRGVGLCMISHSEEKEIKVKGKQETETKITHTLPPKARKLIAGMADMILYMEVEPDGRRVIRTKPTTIYEAGDRTGKLPETLPLNYDAFVKAYYGGNEGEAKEKLIVAIEAGLAYLKEHTIDGFDTEKRVANSMTKHLGFANLRHPDVTIKHLQAYLQHLRLKGKEQK
jgi:hypothetical protein